LYAKNKLKKENNIKIENVISLVFVFIMLLISLTGKNPPDEIIVIDKLKESKVLMSINFNIMNINKVNDKYKTKILNDCLNVSE
tara:strand:- start:264 stop:515 length:252 start_codon:yes stop_codon:yes gene_type:complete